MPQANSAERVRPKFAVLGPKSAPKPDEATPKMPGEVPTNQHKPLCSDRFKAKRTATMQCLSQNGYGLPYHLDQAHRQNTACL